MRIDLRGGNILMTEHELQRPQIRAMFEQMRRKRMAQRMRRNRQRQPGLFQIFFDDAPERLARHLFAEPIDEQCFDIRSFQEDASRFVDIPAKIDHRRFAERHDALFIPFADAAQKAAFAIHVTQPQRHQFRDAQARRIKRFQHRFIPHRHRPIFRRDLISGVRLR